MRAAPDGWFASRVQAAIAPQRERAVPDSWWVWKRWIDLTLGSLLFLIVLPIVAVAAAGIVCVTGGSPFYAQERVGMNGRRFKMFKLRTMVNGAHQMRAGLMHLNEADGPVFKIRNDPRFQKLIQQ